MGSRVLVRGALLATLLLVMLGTGAVSATTWQIESVEGAGTIGESDISLALDSAGNPHICYRDDDNGGLEYATYDGAAWRFATVDPERGAGMWASIVLDFAGKPRIAYSSYDGATIALRYAWYDGSAWHTETVDADGSVGAGADIALYGYYDSPRIAYLDDRNAALKYAANDGSGWTIETVDATAKVGEWISLAIDPTSSPHISYHDYTGNYDLKHAWYDWGDRAWHTEVVESEGNDGSDNSIAFDNVGRPVISYMGDTGLQYASYDGSAWHIETVDAKMVRGGTSLAVNRAGHPCISYTVDEGSTCHPDEVACDPPINNLKFATFDGTAWQTETVDASGTVGTSTALAMDSAGIPRIAYRNDESGGLTYAAGAEDAAPPMVVAVSPPDGAVDVALNPEIKVTFNEPVHFSNWGSPMDLTVTDGVAVLPFSCWRLSNDWKTLTVQIGDGTLLAPDTTYSATLMGVQDYAGNTMAAPYSWSFTTGDNQPPTATFTSVPGQGIVPLTVAFDAGSSSDPDGTIAAYDWTFGDGATGSGPSVSHTYTAPGPFYVQLTVTDDEGAVATWIGTIFVKTPVEATVDLKMEVSMLVISDAAEKVLVNKLDAAIVALNAGDTRTATRHLNTFMNLVQKNKGLAITPAEASTLTAEATRIIRSLR